MTAETTKPSIPIWGVRHIAFRVRDIEAARRWYEDVLGMEVEDEFPGQAIFVRFGPYYHHGLAIFQADKDADLPAQSAVGLAHIALLVDSLEGVRQWYHHLQANGVEVRGSDHGGGPRRSTASNSWMRAAYRLMPAVWRVRRPPRVASMPREPMRRAQQEWKRSGRGAWDYAANGEVLRAFWAEGIRRNRSYESIVTLGMRGDGDLPMSEEANVALLDELLRVAGRI